MSHQPTAASIRSLLLAAITATGTGALIGTLLSAYVLRKSSRLSVRHRSRRRHCRYRSSTASESDEDSVPDSDINASYTPFALHPAQQLHSDNAAAAAAGRTLPTAYHTRGGGIVTRYLDPLSRISTNDLYSQQAFSNHRYSRTHQQSFASAEHRARQQSRHSGRDRSRAGWDSPLSPIGADMGVLQCAQSGSPPSESFADINCSLPASMRSYLQRCCSPSPQQPATSPTHAGAAASPSQSRLLAPQNPIYRIVITGGPCSGKSTCLTYLKDHLEGFGYAVLCVPEVATMLMTGGARLWLTPEEITKEAEETAAQEKLRRSAMAYQQALRAFAACDEAEGGSHNTSFMCGDDGDAGAKKLSMTKIVMQRVVLQLMMILEDCFYEMAVIRGKPTVILCDRGTMDGSAYCTDEEWTQILASTGYTNDELRDTRYDAVVHLVTAALGAEHYYSLENNATRYETPEEAVSQDMATRRAWRGHFLVYTVDNATNFEKKIERAAAFIQKVIGVTTADEHYPQHCDQRAQLTPTLAPLLSPPSPAHAQGLTTHMTALARPGEPDKGSARGSPGSSANEARSQHPPQGSTLSFVAYAQDCAADHHATISNVVRAPTLPGSLSSCSDCTERGTWLSGKVNPLCSDERRATLPLNAVDGMQARPAAADTAAAVGPSHSTLDAETLLSSGMTSGAYAESDGLCSSPSTAITTATTAAWGLQRHFIIKSIDRNQIPEDAVSASVATIVLIPRSRDYVSELVMRRAYDGHPSRRPVYLRRVEYARPLFAGQGGDDTPRTPSSSSSSYVCRNISTRPISKDEFLALAQHFDPTQPLIQKHTAHFVHGLKHLTVETFASPEELQGVTHLVGPPDLCAADLPPWIEVYEGPPLTAQDSFV